MTSPLSVSSGSPVVMDTSVAFKWFDIAEPGGDEAERLLEAHGRDEIALSAPAHLPLELLNIHAGRGASAARLAEVAAGLADAGLLLAPLDTTLLGEAARIATSERLSLSAAAFIALAVLLDAPLVTADPRQGATRSCEVRLLG